MKYINLIKSGLLLAFFAVTFTACDKVTEVDPIGDGGQTLVKLVSGGAPGGTPAEKVSMPIDFVATPTQILTIQVRRDVANNADMNKTMIVTVKDDTAAVTVEHLVQFPPSWFTVQTDAVKSGGQGGVWTFTFQPGELSKTLYVTIPDATILDPSSSYGLGYTILTADANGNISEQKSVVVEIGAKNDWDGLYEVTGTYVDVSNATFVSDYPFIYALVTKGATQCDVINTDLNGGIPGYLFSTGSAGSYYGSYGYVISFDPATGAISDLHNYYGDPTKPATGGGNPATGSGPPNYVSSNGRSAVLDPSGVNAAQSNKDIIIKHWMMQPSVVPVGPRVKLDEVWKYVGSR